jgi:alpha-1,2-glucosyltransferase
MRFVDLEAGLLLAVLLGITSIWVTFRQPEPYMDELFHVPQALEFCSSIRMLRFPFYDQAITTPPGLYAVPALMSFLVPSVCTTRGLRGLSAAFVGLSLPILASLISKLRRRIPRAASLSTEDEASTSLLALVLLLNPPMFFLASLFYTDPPAIFALLVCMHLDTTGHYFSSACAGVYASSCRQTCALFHCFIALQEMVFHVRIRKGCKYIIRASAPHACAGLLYLYLFYKNSFRITLGDHSHHEFSWHYAMFAYNGGYFMISSLPLLASVLILRSDISRHIPMIRSKYCVLAYVTAGTISLLLVQQSGSFVHPFVLADNRHYTFYLYRRILLRGPMTRASLALVYGAGLLIPFVSMQICFRRITRNARKCPILLLEWLQGEVIADVLLYMCISACIIPSSLLEPRYFVPGYLIMMLRSLGRLQITKAQARLCILALVALNIGFLFVFCELPFGRAVDEHMPHDKSPGRFMF